MGTEDIVRELENLPSVVHCGFYYLRITHSLREKVVEMLKKQIPLIPMTEGNTEKWDGHLYCPCCGHSIKRESNYCSNCGQKITWIV